MGLLDFLFGDAKSWRGYDGEDQMTETDWMKRGGEQARAAHQCGDPFISSPDSEGHPTGGDYNGDYPDSYHEQLNAQMEEDEYYEADIDSGLHILSRTQFEHPEL